MRTVSEVLQDNMYAGQTMVSLQDAKNAMEDYATSKQNRIDELEYKLTKLQANIMFAIGECDNQLAGNLNASQVKGMTDLKNVLKAIMFIPEVTATVKGAQ